jgi:hypothetical protein
MHWRACTLWVRSVHARKKPSEIAVGNYPRPPLSPDGCFGSRICLDLSRALPEHGQASLDVRSSRALPLAGCDRARPPKAIPSMSALRTQSEPRAPGYVLSHLQRHVGCERAARLASRTHAAITLDHTAAGSAPRAVGTALNSSADRVAGFIFFRHFAIRVLQSGANEVRDGSTDHHAVGGLKGRPASRRPIQACRSFVAHFVVGAAIM